jgi:arylsulfatase A-like enzyme
LRADALAAYGGDPTLMPELNAFLAGADRFQDMQVNATWTRPSVASFFTGLLAEEHGARGVQNFLGEEFATLPEALQQRGYRTAAFVTNHAAVGKKTGFAQGFELFVEFPQKPYARAAEVRSAIERRLPLLVEPPGDAGSKPLFLYVHFLDPHEPYLSGKVPRGKRRAEYLAAYAAELRYLDRELGALLRYFESTLAGPVVTLVTADHGEEFFEHGQYSHGLSLYQEVLRIPFAVRSPTSSGRDFDSPLEQRDTPALLLAHASGLPVDHGEWGARAARRQRYSSIYFSGYRRGVLRPYLRQICMRSVREGSLKLIWSGYGDTHELYDLASDPGELSNLAAARPDEVARLRAAMEGAVPAWSFGRTFAATGEELEQLRALGYIQ